MECSQVSLAILALIVVISVHTAYSIQCYECNSNRRYEGKPCGDPIDKSQLEIVDCNAKYGQKYGQNYTMCRKMHQKVEGDSRIMRSCAVSGNDKCFDRTGTKQIAVRYCECNGDGCNSASTATLSIIATTIFATLAVVLRT